MRPKIDDHVGCTLYDNTCFQLDHADQSFSARQTYSCLTPFCQDDHLQQRADVSGWAGWCVMSTFQGVGVGAGVEGGGDEKGRGK